MKNLSIGKKIIIVGCPGSGKSTFAVKLQRMTGLPLIHLDNMWWNNDRTHVSRDEFDAKLNEILKTECWIIDGDYSRTYDMRIRSCDTVVFLDFDTQTCMNGITERIGKKRADIPWVEDRLDPELSELVRDYNRKNRPVLYSLFEKYPGKHTLVFKTRSAADQWLAKI